MRFHILNALTGALGLAAVVASAPAVSSFGTPDDCVAPSTATVFVTVPASSPDPLTIYVALPVSSVDDTFSEAPTSTLTRFATLYSTTISPQTFTEYLSAAPPSSATGQANTELSYAPTITETAVITVTDIILTPLSSGGSLTYTETPAPNGILYYVVENDTTSWFDGQTPALSESYVYSTSSVTVIPVYPTASTSEQGTSIVTLQSTIHFTQQLTLTETLKSASASGGRVGVVTPASIGTGLPYTKGSGGWNATKTSNAGGVLSGATNGASAAAAAGLLVTGSPTLLLYSSFNIYKTSHTAISKSSLAAQSGFNVFNTPDPGSATSSASSEMTTAAINGVTITWGGISGSASKTSSDTCNKTPYAPTSIGAPYINSTFVTSVRSTGDASGVLTSLSLTSPIVGDGSSPALMNSTTPATSVSGILSLLSSVLSGVSYSSSAIANSSSVLAALTSLSSIPSIALSSSSSKPVYSSSSITSSTVRSTSAAFTSAPVPANSSSLKPSSISLRKTSTSISSSASASPSTCGEYGNFTLNFDDIPPLSIGNQSANSVQPEPVFNPYHQFDFSDGFTVVPPPTDPYKPSSPPLLLEFIPNFNVNGTNTQVGPNTAEEGYSGQISDGDGDQTGCFRFNMYGASFGCDSTGPSCSFTFTGYQLDASRNEVQVASQTIPVAPCPALNNCALISVTLDSNFENLAFVRINCTVAQQPKIWWMDDLRLGWYNNSCTTGLCRQTAHLP